MTQKNKKIECMHCNKHIGNQHETRWTYKSPVTIGPMNGATITRMKISGTYEYARASYEESSVGYWLSVQLKCPTCEKHTTIEVRQEND